MRAAEQAAEQSAFMSLFMRLAESDAISILLKTLRLMNKWID